MSFPPLGFLFHGFSIKAAIMRHDDSISYQVLDFFHYLGKFGKAIHARFVNPVNFDEVVVKLDPRIDQRPPLIHQSTVLEYGNAHGAYRSPAIGRFHIYCNKIRRVSHLVISA